MINKRLLIKNLLAHNDESSFYDKKRQLNLHTREGKAKFLKHICALSNSNPANHSYIVVGVEDKDNEIVGDDFFDDSRIQNLVNAFLEHAPKIQYDNVPFPHLPKGKVVGLVTISPKNKASFFKKGIHTILPKSCFVRIGSNSVPVEMPVSRNFTNVATVVSIENNSRNSIQDTLDSVMDFMYVKHRDMPAHYKVFKELFVICWAGIPKKVKDKTYLSRVDIELINEQVKLFYSAQDEVLIEFNESSFTITEFIALGLNDKTSYYPLERQTIRFFDNGYYKLDTEMLFEPPEYNRKVLHHIYNATLATLHRAVQKPETVRESELESVPQTLMIAYLNGFEDAKQKLIDAKSIFKSLSNPNAFQNFKHALRILRKMKYNAV
ncbi:ATP-binding protein [Flavobacterium aurantiibacter]|uniref:AAA family ATPase n=1 Tax=Flavobacterium aurantiibacter TaxID=2023067 RepID=A0A255ZLJ7_9FLAO|nr:ATP-binding protein [Flavobacterium aurantiibacter]OYQ42279.1 AAA family ATPase [Flavobacterium aurantiibacter]